jgi:hypothetical protein
MTAGPADAELPLARGVPAIPTDTVFFASDPAGQRACLALASLHVGATDAIPRLFCNRDRDVAGDFPLPMVRLDRQPQAEDLDGAALVFCGTSHPDSSGRFELAALALASARGLPSAAFVDHWTNFRLRFQGESGALVLPDRIWVLDAHAARLAEADGLPAERLTITGSPTLAFLAHRWRAPRSMAAIRTAALLGPPDTGPTLLYAPDPISLRAAGGGFDEVSAAGDLAAAVAQAAPGATVVLRLHPLEPAAQGAAMAEAFARRGVRTVQPGGAVGGWELCSVADVVIGFYSNFLLEARALGRAVIRYLPGPPELDPLGHLPFGRRVTRAGLLAEALVASLAPSGRGHA